MVFGIGPAGTTKRFPPEWLEGREMWLVNFGLQGNLYRVRCTACDLVLNSHLHTIQMHEDSARHKQNLAAKKKSSAAVQAFKAALTTGRDRAAAKRKEQMEDPATVMQFAAVFYRGGWPYQDNRWGLRLGQSCGMGDCKGTQV
ncbi:hypothetical protein QJQ45_002857 [Haematococcus lacustris]|nr:hypothetical protein QJQ45_002857 [Haematococcus lacustris]